MVFSSIIFLLGFLPLVIFFTFIIRPELRNLALLCASLFFYWWGEGDYFWLLLTSAAVNFIFGLLLANGWRFWQKPSYIKANNFFNKILLTAAVIFNLGALGYFKYANWAVDNLNALFGTALACNVILPLGISFFTFQALSYVVDVYRGEVRATRNIITFSSYLTLFPQLIAGPIVRYSQVADQLLKREITSDKFASGIRRFVIGLGKKVIIANTMAVIADQVFTAPIENLTTPMAWIGITAYTLQIYYDFSGYSDMAIGMGLMFGFNFPENFDYPYVSRSIREFWRRWHISLSTWFRDYLYIPLGGNRSSSLRVGLNLIIVFLLCGLWHGAAWNFVIWGLWHGLFLAIERTDAFKRLYRLTPLLFKHLYTLWIVMTGWILFRADSLSHAADYFTLCCFGGDFANLYWPLQSVFSPYSIMMLFAGIIGCMPWMKQINRQIEQYKPARNAFARLTEQVLLMILFLFCLAELFASSYNPFIYFRF